MSMTPTKRGSAFARTKSATRTSIALGALLVVGGGALFAASPATAAPSGPGVAPTVEWSTGYGSVITNMKVNSISNQNPSGSLQWNSVLSLGFDFAIPDTAVPGDTFRIALPSDQLFTVQSFSGLQIKTTSGTVVATASSSGSKGIVLTIVDGTLKNRIGKAQITLTPVSSTTAVGTSSITFIGADGTNVGPGGTYTIAKRGPVQTGVGVKSQIIKGTEPGLLVETGVLQIPKDLSTVTYVLHADTKGALPICNAGSASDAVLGWIKNGNMSWTGTKGIVDCDLETGTMTIKVPAGVTVPADAEGLAFTTWWQADTQGKDYKFTADMSMDGTSVIKVGTGRSPVLSGGAAGEIRKAAITISKDSPTGDEWSIGDIVPYEVVTENPEALTIAYGIVPTDTIPEGTEFVSASDGGTFADGKVTWPATDIAPGGELFYTLDLRVTEDTPASFTNTVEVTGTNACEAGGDSCTASVTDTALPAPSPTPTETATPTPTATATPTPTATATATPVPVATVDVTPAAKPKPTLEQTGSDGASTIAALGLGGLLLAGVATLLATRRRKSSKVTI